MFTDLNFKSYIPTESVKQISNAAFTTSARAAMSTRYAFISDQTDKVYVYHRVNAEWVLFVTLSLGESFNSVLTIACNEDGSILHVTDKTTTVRVTSFVFNGTTWVEQDSLEIDPSTTQGISCCSCDSTGQYLMVEHSTGTLSSEITFLSFLSNTLTVLNEFTGDLYEDSAVCSMSSNGLVAAHLVEDSLYIYKRSGAVWSLYDHLTVSGHSTSSNVFLNSTGSIVGITYGNVPSTTTYTFNDTGTEFVFLNDITLGSGAQFAVMPTINGTDYLYLFTYYTGLTYSPYVYYLSGSTWVQDVNRVRGYVSPATGTNGTRQSQYDGLTNGTKTLFVYPEYARIYEYF